MVTEVPELSPLGPELAAETGRALHHDEVVAWAGRPVPWRYALRGIPMALFGAFFFVWIAYKNLTARLGWYGQHYKHPNGWVDFLAIGLFALVGAVMVLNPCWLAHRARRTAYVLMDRRALVLDWDGLGRRLVRIYNPKKLQAMRREACWGGTGNLVFEVLRQGQWKYGFLAVRDPKGVEAMVRKLAGTEQG